MIKGHSAMRSTSPLFKLLVLALCLGVASPVRADPIGLQPAAPTWRTTGTWGWAVVGLGIATGAALTSYGLTFDCNNDTDHACQRSASIAIWGGIGVAMLSSAVGLVIVQNGQRRVQLAPVLIAVGDDRREGLVLRGSF
jgi:hypothetical protein